MKNKRALWIGAGIAALAVVAVAVFTLCRPPAAQEGAVAKKTVPEPPTTPRREKAPPALAPAWPSTPEPVAVPKKRVNAFAVEMKNALALYKKGDYAACIASARRVSDAATSETNAGDAADAKQLVAASDMVQALACHRQAQPEEALKLWDKVAQDKENSLAPMAALLQGYEQLLCGQSNEAEWAFERVTVNFVPSPAAGAAALWVKIIEGFREIAAKNEETPPAEPAKPSEQIETLLLAIPAVGKEAKLAPEAEARFQELLDKAHACDDMFPMPPGAKRELDQKKALDYYLKAIEAKPAAGNDPQIMVRLAQMYVSVATQPGGGGAILQDALPLARQAVKLSSVTTAQGRSARMAYFDLLRLSGSFKTLCEEEERTAEALTDPVVLKGLPEDEGPKIAEFKALLVRMLVGDCQLAVNLYPVPQRALARTARAFAGTDPGCEAERGLEKVTERLIPTVLIRGGASRSFNSESLAWKSVEVQVLDAVDDQVDIASTGRNPQGRGNSD